MSTLVPVIDHVVINVANQLNEASALFRRLGFQLTERGHHTLGSSNHLAILGENYLELLGFEEGRGHLRQDIWQSPLGLSGLVWKTTDADEVFQHLQRQDLASDAPASFERPVTLPDGQQQAARFRTVRLRQQAVPNGRSFFCQHFTPHAVWQAAWQQHPNGVTDITEFAIVARDPAQASEVYGRLFGAERIVREPNGALSLSAGVATLRFYSEEQARRRFVDLPSDYQGEPRMAALSLKTKALSQVSDSLRQGDINFEQRSDEILVAAPQAFNLSLRFHQ